MKSPLKTIFFVAFTLVLAFSAVTYNSCKRDKCNAIRCAYGGVCKDGNCICQSGYEGSQCQTITRDKFLGIWSVSEHSSMTHTDRNYSINIAEGANITDVAIHNFYNILTDDLYAYAQGDSLIIRTASHNGRTVTGYAFLDPDYHTVENGKLIIHYAVTIDSSGMIDDYGLYPAVGGTQSVAYRSN